MHFQLHSRKQCVCPELSALLPLISISRYSSRVTRPQIFQKGSFALASAPDSPAAAGVLTEQDNTIAALQFRSHPMSNVIIVTCAIIWREPTKPWLSRRLGRGSGLPPASAYLDLGSQARLPVNQAQVIKRSPKNNGPFLFIRAFTGRVSEVVEI